MAKDLLKLQRSPTLHVRALLRPASFVPETKGLYDLLREFRSNRHHMSILIDEFGEVAGLVTMEDVLEEIVGEIEDEFDIPEENSDIFALADDTYRVAGQTSLVKWQKPSGCNLRTTMPTTLTPLAAGSATPWGVCPSAAKSSRRKTCALWCCMPRVAPCAGSRSRAWNAMDTARLHDSCP